MRFLKKQSRNDVIDSANERDLSSLRKNLSRVEIASFIGGTVLFSVAVAINYETLGLVSLAPLGIGAIVHELKPKNIEEQITEINSLELEPDTIE